MIVHLSTHIKRPPEKMLQFVARFETHAQWQAAQI